MNVQTNLRNRTARLRNRPAAGSGALEYIAALAIAAIIVGGVVLGVSGARVDVFTARAVCFVQSVVGAGQCAEAIGDGPDRGNGPGGESEPWYCAAFGAGCSDERSTDPTDVDIPNGLDPGSDLVAMMLTTERGRLTLQWLADNQIPIVVDRSANGAYWDGTSIVLGPNFDNAAVLIHESNHARYDDEGRGADAHTMGRDEYVRAAIAEEADGTVQQILAAKEFRNTGADIGIQPAEAAYDAAYQQAIAGGATPAEAQRAGHRAVLDEFIDGNIVTSTNGQTYPEYYGGYWDRVNP